MKIATRVLTDEDPPLIVCEIGASHRGSFDLCQDLIWHAADCGADAVKFQCYTPDEITIPYDGPEFMIQEGPWKGLNLYSLYKLAHTPRDWFPRLFDYTCRLNLIPFASVFSIDGVEFLEKLECPAYKIASFEAVDPELIAAAARTGKPLMISTGMMDDEEYWSAYDDAMDAGAQYGQLCMMHCVSAYPCPPEEAAMLAMREGDGLSDHTKGIEAAVIATVRRARVIEKHLKLPNLLGENGPDDGFAVEPPAFKRMVQAVRSAKKMLTDRRGHAEKAHLALRRSLFAVKPIGKGDLFTRDNVRSIRPAAGLAPAMLPKVLKSVAACDIPYGTPLTMEMIAHGE